MRIMWHEIKVACAIGIGACAFESSCMMLLFSTLHYSLILFLGGCGEEF